MSCQGLPSWLPCLLALSRKNESLTVWTSRSVQLYLGFLCIDLFSCVKISVKVHFEENRKRYTSEHQEESISTESDDIDLRQIWNHESLLASDIVTVSGVLVIRFVTWICYADNLQSGLCISFTCFYNSISICNLSTWILISKSVSIFVSIHLKFFIDIVTWGSYCCRWSSNCFSQFNWESPVPGMCKRHLLLPPGEPGSLPSSA